MNAVPDGIPPKTVPIRLRGGTVRMGHAILIDGVDFNLSPHAVTGLVGPNGAGKSTLMKVLARQQALTAGELLLGDRPYSTFAARPFAQRVAYLPQSLPITPGMTVDELVCMGRYPWHGALGRFTPSDRDRVDWALALTGVASLSHRLTDQLSGGERQRCWIAMLLAQEADVLLLDEPVSALDLRYQIEIMELVRRIAQDQGVSVLVVLHDVNLAAHYCDQVAALKSGRILWKGPAEQLMDVQILEAVYETPMSLLSTTEGDRQFAFTRSAKCESRWG